MKTATLTTKDDESAKRWLGAVKNNQEPYGWATIEVIEKLGKNLDDGMDCAAAEDLAVKGSGITGMMAGMMSDIVAKLHPRGAEFQKYWNEKHNYTGEGTVNPAIVTIKDKDEK